MYADVGWFFEVGFCGFFVFFLCDWLSNSVRFGLLILFMAIAKGAEDFDYQLL